VVALALANLGVAVGRDMLELNALHDKVEAQQPVVDRVVAVRRHVLREEQRRADIVARRTGGDPLRMLDAVTAATPSGAWVDRLAFDGRSVRLSGYRQDQVDMAAALRSAPLLTNVRSSGGDLLTRQAAGQPFDLTADLKTAPTTISTLPGGGG
jgi:general secretion pathway protein L